MTPSISVIMSLTNRPANLRNTLKGWAIVDYPDFDFTIIDDGTGNPEIEEIVNEFKDKLPITFHKSDSPDLIHRVWNRYGKESRGEYVVFAMMDEIISHKDIFYKMIKFEDRRSSIFTYFMGEEQTVLLQSSEWDDPLKIPKPFSDQAGAGLISHITGNYRKNWDWFGWFREEDGYLWLDQDIYLREVFLRRAAETPKDVYCLHQYHPTRIIPPEQVKPGYIYRTELQARLLEPAVR